MGRLRESKAFRPVVFVVVRLLQDPMAFGRLFACFLRIAASVGRPFEPLAFDKPFANYQMHELFASGDSPSTRRFERRTLIREYPLPRRDSVILWRAFCRSG